jgi:predicted transcriptional regulator
MTTNDIANHQDFTLINSINNLSQKINKLFASDLLSNVMGQTNEHDCLITMLNNINVIGVASLNDLSCVVFTQGIVVKKELIDKANELNIPLFTTTFSTVKTVIALAKLDSE